VAAVKPASKPVAVVSAASSRTNSSAAPPRAKAAAAPVAPAPKPRAAAPAGKSASAAARDDETATLLAQTQQAMEGLEKERNFYFSKLREIEILCQDDAVETDVATLKKQVLDIMYQTDDAQEFQSPEEGDAPVEASEHLIDAAHHETEMGLLDEDLGAETF